MNLEIVLSSVPRGGGRPREELVFEISSSAWVRLLGWDVVRSFAEVYSTRYSARDFASGGGLRGGASSGMVCVGGTVVIRERRDRHPVGMIVIRRRGGGVVIGRGWVFHRIGVREVSRTSCRVFKKN
jgi:hypothetical protein